MKNHTSEISERVKLLLVFLYSLVMSSVMATDVHTVLENGIETSAAPAIVSQRSSGGAVTAGCPGVFMRARIGTMSGYTTGGPQSEPRQTLVEILQPIEALPLLREYLFGEIRLSQVLLSLDMNRDGIVDLLDLVTCTQNLIKAEQHEHNAYPAVIPPRQKESLEQGEISRPK